MNGISGKRKIQSKNLDILLRNLRASMPQNPNGAFKPPELTFTVPQMPQQSRGLLEKSDDEIDQMIKSQGDMLKHAPGGNEFANLSDEDMDKVAQSMNLPSNWRDIAQDPDAVARSMNLPPNWRNLAQDPQEMAKWNNVDTTDLDILYKLYYGF